MKKIITRFLFLPLGLLSMRSVSAQDFSGYSSGNYAGVNGVFYNPASMADSRYRWDFNLFGVNTLLGNNKTAFNKNDFLHFNADSIKDRFLSGKPGPVDGIVSMVVNGPSLLFNIDKKSTVALTTRIRVLINFSGIDNKLARQFVENGNGDPDFPYTISSSDDMIVNVNAYTEFGLSYARVVYDKQKNFLKAGINTEIFSRSSQWIYKYSSVACYYG